MKCLVIGGAGFIGSHLVDALIEQGFKVTVVDNLFTGKKENINPGAKFVKADIRYFNKIKSLFGGVDYVFHLGALVAVQGSIEDPLLYNEINLKGTLNVLEASRLANVKKFVFSSTAAIYGNPESFPVNEEAKINPLSPYAVQKLAGEMYCKLYSDIYRLRTVCLRYFNVFGDRMSLKGGYSLVLGIFTRQRLSGEALTVTGDGEQRRDFVSADDVSQANIKAALNNGISSGEVINIGSGKNYSINEIARAIGGEVAYVEPRIEPRINLANNSKAHKLLSWDPAIDLIKWLSLYKKKMGIK